MPKIFITCLFLIIGTIVCHAQSDTTLTGRKNYLKVNYRLTEDQAVKTAVTIDRYKQAIKGIISNKAYSSAERQRLIKAQIIIKNEELKKFLSPKQQESIIPTTEREKQ